MIAPQETSYANPPWMPEFEQIRPLLLRKARRLVGQEAEDIVQSAFLRACNKQPRNRSKFRAWMTTTVVRTALNLRRQRIPVAISSLKADGSSNGGWEHQVKAPSETSLWKRLDRKELHQAVERVMENALNYDERRVLALKVAGETHAEIALSLGLPLSTVIKMLCKSLYILRSFLKERGVNSIH